MKWRRVLITSGLVIATQSGLLAESLTMEEAVRTALMQNAELAAARFETRKAEGRLRASGLLPNPEIEFSGLSDFVGGNEGEGEMTLGLYQTFPLTSRLGIAREISRVGVAESLREIRNQERLLISQVQGLYVRIQAAQVRKKIAKNAQSAFGRFTDLAKQRLDSGQGSLAESALARVEAQRWSIMAGDSYVESEKALLELKTLLNMPVAAPLELTQSLDAIVGDLKQRMKMQQTVQRPDVELQLLALDRVGAEARLARASAWEGIRIGIEYKHDKSMDEPEGLGTGDFLGVGISLPLPVWDRKAGERITTEAAVEQQAVKIHALELQVANEIASARKQAGLYAAQWESYNKETAELLRTMDREMEDGFKDGRVDAVDVISVRLQSDTLSYEAIQTLENYALSLVGIETVSGTHPAINTPYVSDTTIRKSKKTKR